MFGSIKQALFNLIYPANSNCFFCQSELTTIDLYGLCLNCIEEIMEKRNHVAYCQTCGHFGVKAFQCNNCRSWSGELEFCQGVGPYLKEYHDLITQLKFKNRLDVAKTIGYLMYCVIINDKLYRDIDLIIPVPMYWSKKIQRGFNQADILAREIGNNLKIPIEATVLYKAKKTICQSSLSRTERMTNILGTVTLNKEHLIINKHILLVDDIITTGATLNACAKLLKDAGAKKVSAITWAAGVN